MYTVKSAKTGNVIVMCSRYEDAAAYLLSDSVDKDTYLIEELLPSEMEESIIRMAEEYEDGIGEGQPS